MVDGWLTGISWVGQIREILRTESEDGRNEEGKGIEDDTEDERRQEQRSINERERTFSRSARHCQRYPVQYQRVFYHPSLRWGILLSRVLKVELVERKYR